MRPTRRYWAVVGLTVLLAVSAWLFDQPTLLVGVATLGGWLVASAHAFLVTVTDVDDKLELELSTPNTRVPVDAGTELGFAGQQIDVSAAVTARLRLPAGLSATGNGDVAAIRLTDDGPMTSVVVETPVAGRFTVPSPEITVVDGAGLFTERFDRGPSLTLTVEPRQPDDLTVGAGGERVASLGGQQADERRSEGIEPSELREYTPGENAGRIDWNATARLTETYVREFEAQSAIETAFIVDARSTTATGPDGETEFDYLREVALGLLSLFRSHEDPVGITVIDDEGIASLQRPSNDSAAYEGVRRRLLTTGPTEGEVRPPRRLDSRSSLAGRLVAVDAEDSVFIETLTACVDERRPLPPDRSPLRSAVQALGDNAGGRIVLFTDDTNRREIREVVEAARDASDSVLVFLAPTVLHEPGSLADLEAAYERYTEFETFRRELDRLGGVEAFEVGPGGRSERLRKAKRTEAA
jgi:uncharacterized protein (DUF58 family)